MAKRFVIELIDDLDGSEATETLRFGLDGANYEIDLGRQNAEELRAVLRRFAETGRRADSSRPRGGGERPASLTTAATGTDAKAVRRWAAENGIAVSPRGRINDQIVQSYLASVS